MFNTYDADLLWDVYSAWDGVAVAAETRGSKLVQLYDGGVFKIEELVQWCSLAKVWTVLLFDIAQGCTRPCASTKRYIASALYFALF